MSSNSDKTRREALAVKYPEMDQHFQELKKQDNTKVERLGQTKK